jgi:hypothetical protein
MIVGMMLFMAIPGVMELQKRRTCWVWRWR